MQKHFPVDRVECISCINEEYSVSIFLSKDAFHRVYCRFTAGLMTCTQLKRSGTGENVWLYCCSDGFSNNSPENFSNTNGTYPTFSIFIERY